jgi:peroxiredoxin
MLQAEIAGRLIPPHEGYAERGDVIRDFQLFSAEGQSVLLSEYRGLSSMVLVFAGESDSANNLLSELGTHQPELTGNETRALAIVVGPQERASELRHTLHLGFEVLADENGRVHHSLGTEDRAGHLLPAVFITDRFGEVFAAYKAGQGKSLPAIDEILSWIDFINRQCPECGPIEWPA